MIPTPAPRPFAHRGGFTLTEVLIVSGLMSLLALILSTLWSGLGRPLADAAARACLIQEIALASAALARDLGGNLADPESRLGTKRQGEFLDWSTPNGAQLRLRFAGNPKGKKDDWGNQNTTIVYSVEDGQLVREDTNAKTSMVIAEHVEVLSVTCDSALCQIELIFRYRGLTRTCSWIARIP